MSDFLRYLDAAQAAVNAAFDTFRTELMGSQMDRRSSAALMSASTDPVERPETWRQAVLDVIAGMPEFFRFSDVYKAEEYYSRHFPGNRSIMQSVAGILRQLVNEGLIKQTEERGLYRHDVDDVDTIVVPARTENFEQMFLSEKRWHAIRIHESMIPKIKNIAVYRTAPDSAITHIAPVKDIVRSKDEPQKYEVLLSRAAEEIGPVTFVPGGSVPPLRNIRYTSRQQLLKAQTLDELWPPLAA